MGQLSLMFVVCELRSRLLTNYLRKESDIPKSSNLDTDIMNFTQTISKVAIVQCLSLWGVWSQPPGPVHVGNKRY